MLELTCGQCGGAVFLDDQPESGAQFLCPHCGSDIDTTPAQEPSATDTPPLVEPSSQPTPATAPGIAVRKRYSGVILVTLLVTAYAYFGLFGFVWTVFNYRRLDSPVGGAALLLALSIALLWCACQGCLSAQWRHELLMPALFGATGVLAQWGALRVLSDTAVFVERIHVLEGTLGAYLPVLVTAVLVLGLVLLSIWDCPGLQPQIETEAASVRHRQAAALQSTPDTPPPTRVEANRFCRRCGYNLRGLEPNGRCPECGTPVTNSLTGHDLSTADPHWLARIRTGLDLMRLGVLLAVGATAALIAAVSTGKPQAWETRLALLHLAGQFAFLGGVWLLTGRDPGAGDRPYRLSLRVVRVAALILTADTCLAVLTAVGALAATTGGILRALFVAAVMFTLFTTHLHVLSHLAARIPHDKLADSARRLLYGFGYGTGIFAFFLLAAPGVAALIAIGLVVLGVHYVVLLERMRLALTRVIASARQLHASP